MTTPKEITFEPPKCPACGANLFRVFENSYETYTWKPKKGTYEGDGTSKMTCPDCGADLYDVFPDGVCNYEHPSKRR